MRQSSEGAMSEAASSTFSEQELFATLGTEILLMSKMGAGVSEGQKAELGRTWFKAHLSEIRAVICENATIEDLATKSDTTDLVAAVGPLLGFSPTVAASATLALLVARIGVRRICTKEWSEK